MSFTTDAHRRVAANLAQPRNLDGLAAVLFDDPHTRLHAPLEVIVDELCDAGLAKNIGSHGDAHEVVGAVQADDEVIDLHPEKAACYVDHFSHPRREKHLAGDQYVLTKHGLEELVA